jgi:uncharacterized protein
MSGMPEAGGARSDLAAHALTLLPGGFAICRLAADAGIPAWAAQGEFFSITRTSDELSIVVDEPLVPSEIPRDSGWRCFRVEGPVPLASVGVLASLAVPLARASVSLFVISTHDTDYLLVKAEAVPQARQALRRAGHTVLDSSG